MKVSFASAVLSLSAIAAAQSLAGLPSCAQTVAMNSPATSACTNLECICQNVTTLQPTIDSSCSNADQQTACTWANSACATYGITLSCDGSSSSSSSTTTSTSSSATTDGGPAITSASANMSGTSATSETGTGISSTNSKSASSPSTMVTSTTAMNATMSCTSGWNSTQYSYSSTKPMSSKTSSDMTSQYTGAASAAGDRRAGVVGTVIGAALLFAFF